MMLAITVLCMALFCLTRAEDYDCANALIDFDKCITLAATESEDTILRLIQNHTNLIEQCFVTNGCDSPKPPAQPAGNFRAKMAEKPILQQQTICRASTEMKRQQWVIDCVNRNNNTAQLPPLRRSIRTFGMRHFLDPREIGPVIKAACNATGMNKSAGNSSSNVASAIGQCIYKVFSDHKNESQSDYEEPCLTRQHCEIARNNCSKEIMATNRVKVACERVWFLQMRDKVLNATDGCNGTDLSRKEPENFQRPLNYTTQNLTGSTGGPNVTAGLTTPNPKVAIIVNVNQTGAGSNGTSGPTTPTLKPANTTVNNLPSITLNGTTAPPNFTAATVTIPAPKVGNATVSIPKNGTILLPNVGNSTLPNVTVNATTSALSLTVGNSTTSARILPVSTLLNSTLNGTTLALTMNVSVGSGTSAASKIGNTSISNPPNGTVLPTVTNISASSLPNVVLNGTTLALNVSAGNGTSAASKIGNATVIIPPNGTVPLLNVTNISASSFPTAKPGAQLEPHIANGTIPAPTVGNMTPLHAPTVVNQITQNSTVNVTALSLNGTIGISIPGSNLTTQTSKPQPNSTLNGITPAVNASGALNITAPPTAVNTTVTTAGTTKANVTTVTSNPAISGNSTINSLNTTTTTPTPGNARPKREAPKQNTTVNSLSQAPKKLPFWADRPMDACGIRYFYNEYLLL